MIFFTIVYNFPLVSGLKMIVGFSMLGFFAAVDLALNREKLIVDYFRETGSSIEPDDKIFRVTLENIPLYLYRGIDFSAIRELSRKAIHYEIKANTVKEGESKPSSMSKIDALTNEFEVFLRKQSLKEKETLLKEAQIEAKDTLFKIKSEFEAETKDTRAELKKNERRLIQKEEKTGFRTECDNGKNNSKST